MRKTIAIILLTMFLILSVQSVFAITTPKNDYQYSAGNIVELDSNAGNYLISVQFAYKPEGSKYVADTKTHVFHTANCPYVKKLSGKHKVYYYSHAKVISDGFRPCPTCRP
jgi:hypothetical protein